MSEKERLEKLFRLRARLQIIVNEYQDVGLQPLDIGIVFDIVADSNVLNQEPAL